MTEKDLALPWKIGFDDGSGAFEDNNGAHIVGAPVESRFNVIVRGGNPEGDMPYGVLKPEHAAFIVTACNNHHRLLAALKGMVAATEVMPENMDAVEHAARVAIHEAEAAA